MRKYFALLFIITWSLFAQDGVIIDLYFSPYMGSYDLLALHKSIQDLDARVIKKREKPRKGFIPGVGRFGYLFAFWDPLNVFLSTVQHEVFGHGFRIRSMPTAHEAGYNFSWPWPYGSGGGSTSYDISKNYSAGDNALVAIAGIEAEYIIAKQLKTNWLTKSSINPYEITLYQNAQQSLLLYSLVTSLSEMFIKAKAGTPYDGNDIKSYIATINLMYPSNNLTHSQIEVRAFLNLLDPMTFYNIYAWWYFVVTGKSFTPPVIHIGEVSYLPNFKFSLAPYGPEYGLENYFVFPGNKPLMVYVKGGGYGGKSYVGVGGEYLNAVAIGKGSLGVKCDLWYQPSLKGSESLDKLIETTKNLSKDDLKTNLVGVALSAIGQYEIGKKGCHLFLEIGGKTRGYLPGYTYRAFPTFRLGVTGKY